ncbi:MAG: chromate transporter [Oscillospiraceae bacterium]|nr:chromate transporter [Oscillospiraceae bacterium]
MLKDLLEIYWKFFKMGAVTFGGGYAMLPILRREIVETSHWMKEEDILDYYALSQGLPGIIAINVGSFVGYHHKKAPGAVAAALGVVTPSIIIISVIAFFLSGFKENPYVRHALSAISVCVVALILDAVISMWKKGVKDAVGIVVCVAALAFSLLTKISPVILVIAGAVIGMAVRAVTRARDAKKEGEAK